MFQRQARLKLEEELGLSLSDFLTRVERTNLKSSFDNKLAD